MNRFGLVAVRYGIPLAMVIGGVVALAIGGDWAGFGVVVVGSALIVALINALFRMSLTSNRERDAEEHAREYFERHGRWPDDQDASNPSSR
jgi:pilus assembly protein TadC